MKEEVEELKKEETFALEILKELKEQNNRQHIANKRQHITIIILIAVIVAMIIGFFIFANQFELVGEETTLDAGNGTATYLENSNSGDINYGENN